MYFIYLYFILFVELLYKCTSIWRKLMSLIEKRYSRKTSLIFTKTPLKFSSISLIAEKKYGNYENCGSTIMYKKQ